MKYAICYSSKTGNTELLAQKIQSLFHSSDCIYFGSPDSKALDADIIFVGSWTDKGSCDPEAADFLKKLNQKKVFLFGTSGFGANETYFEQIISRFQSNLEDSNTVIGTFMCQGKMPQSVRQRYESMLEKDPVKMQSMIDNFDQALTHPNAADLEQLTDKVKAALSL